MQITMSILDWWLISIFNQNSFCLTYLTWNYLASSAFFSSYPQNFLCQSSFSLSLFHRCCLKSLSGHCKEPITDAAIPVEILIFLITLHTTEMTLEGSPLITADATCDCHLTLSLSHISVPGPVEAECRREQWLVRGASVIGQKSPCLLHPAMGTPVVTGPQGTGTW